MSTTAQLIESINGMRADEALLLLESHPDAAKGLGPAGESPLLAAVYRGMRDVATCIAAYRDMSLAEAAALGEVDTVRWHLEKNPASVAERSPDGWTPLHLAGFFGNVSCARALIAAGADIEAVAQNGTANTPLGATLAGTCSLELVVLLLGAGANVNVAAELQYTPLHVAASRGATDIVRLLLRLGANPNARMNDGRTPAELARERGHADAAAALDAASGFAP